MGVGEPEWGVGEKRVHEQAGWSAVMVAVQEGHLDVVRLLVERAADINLQPKVNRGGGGRVGVGGST